MSNDSRAAMNMDSPSSRVDELVRVRVLSLFMGVFILLVIYAIWPVRHWLFGHGILEFGDFAANALSVIRAEHFQDLYGNYSRWHFNHPGPVFFYLYALGTKLFFNLLHVVQSPHQAKVLTGILVQAAFLASAIALFAKLKGNVTAALVWMLAAAVMFPWIQNVLTSIWPPHVLFGPFVLLLVSAAGLSFGNMRLLPVSVLAASFLCESHIAQPAIALPVLVIALVLSLRVQTKELHSFKRALSDNRLSIAIAVSIAILFMLPIFIDLTRCPNCNLDRILRYLHQKHGEKPTWGQAFNYVAGFFWFDHNPLWLDARPYIHIFTHRVNQSVIAIAVAAIIVRMCTKHAAHNGADATSVQRHNVEARTFALSVLALIASLIWAKHIRGGFYEFDAHYVYAIYFVLVCSTVVAMVGLARRYRVAVVVVLILATLGACIAKHPSMAFSEGQVYSAPAPDVVKKLLPSKQQLLIDIPADDVWAQALSIAVLAARGGNMFWVAPEWGFATGRMHDLPPGYLVTHSKGIVIVSPIAVNQPTPGNTRFNVNDFCEARFGKPFDTKLGMLSFNILRKQCDVATYGFEQVGRGDWAWTVQKTAAIQMPVTGTTKPVTFTMDVAPFLGGGRLASQSFTVWVNGMRAGQWQLRKETRLRIEVPPDVWNMSDVATVVFSIPNAISPAVLEKSPKGDGRTLGVRVIALGISAP